MVDTICMMVFKYSDPVPLAPFPGLLDELREKEKAVLAAAYYNQDGAPIGFEMCFAVGSQHLRRRGAHRSKQKHASNADSAIKKFKPYLRDGCLVAVDKHRYVFTHV